ncbi:unnamed protein product [Effrenium voratum]|nr:unnamed protein product [Effrenium voratum]
MAAHVCLKWQHEEQSDTIAFEMKAKECHIAKLERQVQFLLSLNEQLWKCKEAHPGTPRTRSSCSTACPSAPELSPETSPKSWTREAKMESTAVFATALEQQLQQQAKAALEAELEQSKAAASAAASAAEEAKADVQISIPGAREEAKASVEEQLQKAKEAEAALTAELEQSKAAASAAEEAKAELAAKLRESKDAAEAAECFKADLQPSLESFKDRILALEAQLPGDLLAQADTGSAEDGQDEGGASAKSRRCSFSCCARRRSQEAAFVEELGFRLQGVAERLNALKQSKAEVEAKMESTAVFATALEQQLQQSQEECSAAKAGQGSAGSRAGAVQGRGAASAGTMPCHCQFRPGRTNHDSSAPGRFG